MILFQEDWRTQNAVPDFDTSNRSFVELAAIYKKMGVKNFAFILALHDQSLKGIDPFSENLTKDQQARIALECRTNPWYFFREVARVPGGGDGVKLRANRANVASRSITFF
jgi:hypothetical protein